jgi:hypothetical protein
MSGEAVGKGADAGVIVAVGMDVSNDVTADVGAMLDDEPFRDSFLPTQEVSGKESKSAVAMIFFILKFTSL